MNKAIQRKAARAVRSIFKHVRERRRRADLTALGASPHLMRDIGLFDTNVGRPQRPEFSRVTLG